MNKQSFLIAAETDSMLKHLRFAVIEPATGFGNASNRDWLARGLAPDAKAYTDGLACFRRIEEVGHPHAVLATRGVPAAAEARGARWMNVPPGN